MTYLPYLALLSLVCFSCSCNKADILLKDAERVNADVIKLEIDAENPMPPS